MQAGEYYKEIITHSVHIGDGQWVPLSHEVLLCSECDWDVIRASLPDRESWSIWRIEGFVVGIGPPCGSAVADIARAANEDPAGVERLMRGSGAMN